MTDLAPFAPVTDLLDSLETPVSRDRALVALTRASGAIRGFCHWPVSQQVLTNQVVNQRRQSGNFWLPTLWLSSVDKVVEGGTTLTAHTDYEWDASGRVVRATGTYWSVYLGALLVDYTHGYPPGDHRLEACYDVCLAAAARLVSNPKRHASESTGSESWTAGAGSGGTLNENEERQLAHLVLDW